MRSIVVCVVRNVMGGVVRNGGRMCGENFVGRTCSEKCGQRRCVENIVGGVVRNMVGGVVKNVVEKRCGKHVVGIHKGNSKKDDVLT